MWSPALVFLMYEFRTSDFLWSCSRLSSFPSDKGRNKNCNSLTIASFMILIHHLPSTIPQPIVFHTVVRGMVLSILRYCHSVVKQTAKKTVHNQTFVKINISFVTYNSFTNQTSFEVIHCVHFGSNFLLLHQQMHHIKHTQSRNYSNVFQ